MPDRKPKSPPDGGLKIVRRKKNKIAGSSTPLLSRVMIQKPDGEARPSLLAFTLLFIYKNLYILGITLLRRKMKYARRIRLTLSRIRGGLLAFSFAIRRGTGRFLQDARKRLKAPFLRISSVYREQRPIIASKLSRRQFPLASYLQVLEAVFRMFSGIVKTLLNHVAPILACAVLIFLVNGFISQSFGLEVIYRDKNIGYIKSESDFESALRDVKSRTIVGGYGYTTSVPSFELVVCVDPGVSSQWLMLYNQLLQRVGFKLVELESFTPVSDLATSIIRASGTEVTEAYGFYIDGRLYGAVTDKSAILNALEIKKTVSSSGKPGERLSFDKSIALYPGIYPIASIVDSDYLVGLINTNETVQQVYVVAEDDTPTGIADKQGISYELLKEINPGIEQKLSPGDEIITAVARPFLSVKTTFTDIYTEAVPFSTVENQNAIYAPGYSYITREGENGLREVTAEVTVVNGIEVSRMELSSVELSAPVSRQVTVGVSLPRSGLSSASVNDTGFVWPVAGYVTYGVGGYPGHTGIDIAGSAGTPIVASASGVVTVAKYGYTGYGVYLKIDHGNGYETLYAHCSALYARVGDYVQQGQIIAARGNTGNSYGNHLHFEVIRNKSIQNPLNYVSQYS